MHLPDEAATAAVGAALAPLLRAGDVVTLTGDLGAGKTALVRGILAALGLADEAPSPSYALVIPYAPPQVAVPVTHADLYRLERPDEVEELGLEDALSDGVLLVEWPERAGEGNWPEALAIGLDYASGGGRNLTVSVPPSWEGRWPFP
jgi:tRNA threonylcarbamoyladenosine biosynthesis protein TsaE